MPSRSVMRRSDGPTTRRAPKQKLQQLVAPHRFGGHNPPRSINVVNLRRAWPDRANSRNSRQIGNRLSHRRRSLQTVAHDNHSGTRSSLSQMPCGHRPHHHCGSAAEDRALETVRIASGLARLRVSNPKLSSFWFEKNTTPGKPRQARTYRVPQGTASNDNGCRPGALRDRGAERLY